MSAHEHMEAGSSDPHSGATLVVGLIGAICLLLIIVAAQVIYYGRQQIEDASKLYAPKPQALLDLQAKQLETINGYRYVDAQAGVVAIPIDRAIELYVARRNSAPAADTISPTTRPSIPE